MKVSYRTIHSVLAFGLVAGASSFAVERPAHLDDEQPRLSEEEARIGEKQKKKDVAIIEVRPEEEIVAAGEKIPYLGIGSVPVSEVLAGHLGLDHGVVVQRVHNGSGAAEAGLQKDDILVTFNGRKIATPLDLRDAVQACDIGDTVEVTLVRKGVTEEREVVLSERPDGLPRFAPGNDQQGLGQLQQVWPGNGGNGGMPDQALERLEQLRGMIDEQFNGVGLGLKMNDILDGQLPDGGEPMNVELGAQSSVTWADAEGDITMKMSNGDTKVTVRDRKGNVLFKGPWNNEEDKAAVEPAIRERIENMGVSRRGNQLKFWMGQPQPGGR